MSSQWAMANVYVVYIDLLPVREWKNPLKRLFLTTIDFILFFATLIVNSVKFSHLITHRLCNSSQIQAKYVDPGFSGVIYFLFEREQVHIEICTFYWVSLIGGRW